MEFYGYERPDGRIGIRNHVLILPASICATDTARMIANQVDGAVSFTNQLGCIHKGGSTVINAVYDYGKQIKEEDKGLIIMDTPGNDASSIAGMAAGGAQICVFSTGRGTPLGSPIIPVIKITGNRDTYRKMRDNMDFDASPVVFGEQSAKELAQELLKIVLDTCDGQKTKAEAPGFTETAIMRACNFV